MSAQFLGRFSKQTREKLDYDMSFTEWFSNRSDAPALIDPVAVEVSDPALVIESVDLTGLALKIVLSGGVNGATYKVTVLMTTTTGIIKEGEFQLTIKDI